MHLLWMRIDESLFLLKIQLKQEE